MERARKTEFARTVLSVIAVAGMLSAVALAPNVVGALAPMLVGGRRKDWYPNYCVNRSIRRLRARGLIVLVRRGGAAFYQLTPEGEELLFKYRLKEIKIKVPRRWDKRWRLVVFDVREKLKYLRDQARETLEQLGFHRLQDSVWIYPHDCSDVIELLRTSLGLRQDILCISCDRFPQDVPLMIKFGLQ
jgi:hypothetical protein